jgi:hypothetical protein
MRCASTIGVGLLLLLSGGVDGQSPESRRTDLAKEADAWRYPRAREVSSAEADRVFQAVMTTDDDPNKVLKHYDQKCGTALAVEDNPPGVFDSLTEVAGGKQVSTLSADDSSVPIPMKKKGTPRGVVLRQLTRNEPGFFITVLVTRSKDDTRTHLLVTYLKK